MLQSSGGKGVCSTKTSGVSLVERQRAGTTSSAPCGGFHFRAMRADSFLPLEKSTRMRVFPAAEQADRLAMLGLRARSDPGVDQGAAVIVEPEPAAVVGFQVELVVARLRRSRAPRQRISYSSGWMRPCKGPSLPKLKSMVESICSTGASSLDPVLLAMSRNVFCLQPRRIVVRRRSRKLPKRSATTLAY